MSRGQHWLAHRVRVRRNFVRGEYGTPKSKRSTRALPLADRLARELDALHRTSSRQADQVPSLRPGSVPVVEAAAGFATVL